jgi:hypothetical protein
MGPGLVDGLDFGACRLACSTFVVFMIGGLGLR